MRDLLGEYGKIAAPKSSGNCQKNLQFSAAPVPTLTNTLLQRIRQLMPMVAADDARSVAAGREVARLIQGISPGRFAALDQQLRQQSYDYEFYQFDAWRRLSPEAVSRLSRNSDLDPAVIGLFGAHGNGFVRAAVLEYLADVVDGREIPILSLRVNDWVAPVAARATELLRQRLRPENRSTILAMLPFLVRMLGARRRDHHTLLQPLRWALLSDGGDEALRHAGSFDIHVRRQLYEMLDTADADVRSRVATAALNDPDAVVRARTLRRLASDEAVNVADEPVAIFEKFLREDPVPAVRQIALSSLSARAPDRMATLVPSALLDRAARVRALARVLVAEHKLALVPRDMYVQRLTSAVTHGLAVAIEGVGETGDRADVPLLAPFLEASTTGVRRAALHAAAALDVDAAIPHAIAALADEARSVRLMAVRVLETHASHVDFEEVHRRFQAMTDPVTRGTLMPVFRAALKWDAAAYFLEGLTDPHEEVRTVAAALLETWLEHFNRSQARPAPAQVLRIRRLLDLHSEMEVPHLHGQMRHIMRGCP